MTGPNAARILARMNRKRTTGSPDVPTLSVRPGEVPPPHSPEAETALLGTILVDQLSFPSAAQYVKAEDFFAPAHQQIFDAMTRLFESGSGIDAVTVSDALRTKGQLEAAGGMTRLSSLINDAAPATSAEYHAKIIKDKALVRLMIATASAIVSEGYGSELEPREFMDRAESRLFAAGEARLSGTIQRLDETLDRAMARIEYQFEHRVNTTGIPTGYKFLDGMLLGMQKSDLIIVAARPSMGKTSLAMNIAEHVALELNLPVGVFSLEMGAESLIMRMMCSLARVNMRNIRDGFMAETDFPKLTSAAGRLSRAPLFIDDTAGLSILQLRARARRMAQQHGIKLFVIDYLQLLNSTARRSQENRQQEIADISSSIKALAKELDVPVIVLSQLNRELEKDKSRKPRLSDLRESGSIEQDADLVGLLYKPDAGDDEDGNAVESDGVPVNLLIAKQRNGPTGDVHMTFLKPYTRFESATNRISDEDVPSGR
ncbi:MAG: replicative DNA helicase [Verrucomicrobiota bacterium]